MKNILKAVIISIDIKNNLGFIKLCQFDDKLTMLPELLRVPFRWHLNKAYMTVEL